MKKKRSRFKEFLIAIIPLLIIAVTRYAPRFFGYFIWRSISSFAYAATARRRVIVRDNLQRVYGNMPDEKSDKICKAVYRSLGRVYAEFCKMDSLTKKNMSSHVRWQGLHHLDAAMKNGKGVIIPTLHYYNIELMNASLATLGYPVHWIMREVDNYYLDSVMDGIRASAGVKVLKKDGALKGMLRLMRGGGVATVTTDQKSSLNEVWVKFLGQWSANVKSPAVISLRTGAAIVPMFSFPAEDGVHEAYFLPAIEYTPTGNSKKDVAIISQIIADLQSEFIKKHPEVWLWLHRKWSIAPTEKQMAEASEYTGGLKTDISGVR